jgi:DNA adenine methylase
MIPLFMWAGGKTKLINNQYDKFLPEKFDSYHEPFFGGGAMFVWAYEKNPNAKFFINDVNKDIVKIYETIRDDVDAFVEIMDKYQDKFLSLEPPQKKTTVGKKTVWIDNPDGMKDATLEKKHKLPKNKYDWHSIYAERQTRRTFFFKTRQTYQQDYQKWTKTEEAACLYFLMKTAFNGVWQLGKDDYGRFNTPCGLMRQTDSIYDEENVRGWNKALQNCIITSDDFSKTLNNIKSDSYVFLDPPYRSASETEKTYADYGTELGDEFQEKVLDFFHSSCDTGAYTMLSNRDWEDGFFESRRKGKQIEYFDITYTVGRKKDNAATKATEILMIGGRT